MAVSAQDKPLPHKPTEVWVCERPVPGRIPEAAMILEQAGFDGLACADTQNLSGDPYSALCLAAHATQRLGLATGVTNPLTRHPTVTASAILTVHAESGGRAVLGIGRGDSSLELAGLKPAKVDTLARSVRAVRDLVAGREAQLDGATLRNEWASGLGGAPPPVHVSASGPRTIEVAARYADGVNVAVGRDPERVGAALERVRAAASDAGRAPGSFSVGAWVTVVPHPDPSTARALARGTASIFAHFAAMTRRKAASGEPAAVEEVARVYDYTRHGGGSSPQAEALGNELVERFAIAGTPDECARRLVEIRDLGVDRIMVVPGVTELPDEHAGTVMRCWQHDVLPALKAQAPA